MNKIAGSPSVYYMLELKQRAMRSQRGNNQSPYSPHCKIIHSRISYL